MVALEFNEEEHIYTYDGEELVSVTTFLSEYFRKFDADKISKELGERFNKDPQHYLDEWSESAAHGTRVHNAIELFSQQSITQFDHVEERDLHKIEMGIKYLLDNDLTDKATVPEFKIYDLNLKLAGMIDLMIIEPDGVTLVDWKTNKKISKSDFDFETRRVRKCSKPISGTNDCSYEKYNLQLSMYAYMLEQQGWTIKGLKLVHLLDTKYIEYDMKYNKTKIRRLLKHGKRIE